MKRMNDLDLLLCFALIVTNHNHPGLIRERLARLMKRVHPNRRGAVALFIKSRDPAAAIWKLLNEWEPDFGQPPAPVPINPRADREPSVGRDPKTGRYYSLARKP